MTASPLAILVAPSYAQSDTHESWNECDWPQPVMPIWNVTVEEVGIEPSGM